MKESIHGKQATIYFNICSNRLFATCSIFIDCIILLFCKLGKVISWLNKNIGHVYIYIYTVQLYVLIFDSNLRSAKGEGSSTHLFK